jgi:hypothetical protein
MGFITQYSSKVRARKKSLSLATIRTNSQIGGELKVSNRRGKEDREVA